MRRSPWSGLTPQQSLELQDALTHPSRLAMSPSEAAWDVHCAYARRTATLLAGNDLAGALDACAVSVAALAIYRQRDSAHDVEGTRHAVVHEHPAARLPQPGRPSWSSHRPSAGGL